MDEKILNILKEFPDIIYKLDPEGNFTFINDSVHILGYNPKELIGKHFSRILHPEDVKLYSRSFVLPKYKGKKTGDENSPKLFDERRTGERKTKNLEIRLIKKKQTRKKKIIEYIIGSVTAFGDIISIEESDTKKQKKTRGTIGIINNKMDYKKAEQKLKYHSNIIQNVSDAVISTDIDFNILTWNKAAEDMYGWKENEVIGKPVHKVTKLKYLYDQMDKVVKEFFKKGYWKGEFIQEHKDGKTINVLISVSLIEDGNGNPIGAVAVNRDITQRRKMQHEMEERKKYLEKILISAPNVIVTHDAEGRIVEWNPVAEELFGYKHDEAVGKELDKLITGSDTEKYKEARGISEKFLSGTNIEPVETIRYRKDSSPVNVIISGSGIFLDGELVGAIAIYNDITEQKKTEKALRQERDNFINILEAMNDGVCIINQQYYIQYVNNKLKNEFGSYNECKCYEYFHERKNVCPWCKSQDVFNGKTISWEWFSFKNQKLYEVIDTPLKNADGSISKLGILHDITKRKKAEDRIKRRLEMENALAELSKTMVKTKNINRGVNKSLSILGELFYVDQVCLFQKKTGKEVWDFFYEWRKKGPKSFKKKLGSLKKEDWLKFKDCFAEKRIVSIADINILPDKLKKVKGIFKKLKINSFLAMPLYYNKEPFNAIFISSEAKSIDWSVNDVGLLQTAGDIINSCIKKERSQKELTKTLKKLDSERGKLEELTKKFIDTQEKERLYLASEIHDVMLQGLVSVLYFLQMIEIPQKDEKLQKRKDKVLEIIRKSIDKGRALISEIKPIREPEIGLFQAIKKSIHLRFTEKDIEVNFVHPKRFPKVSFETKVNVLRIVQEALMNIRKHAKASEVNIKIEVLKTRIKVEIKDNGMGFDERSVLKKIKGHYGLLTMKERARLVGGKIKVKSNPGKGTTVRGYFPLK